MGARTIVSTPRGKKTHVRRGWSLYDGYRTACGRTLKNGVEGHRTYLPEHAGVTCGPCVAESNAAAARGHWKD